MTDNDDDDYGPSKTLLKKQAAEAQTIGEQLVGFNETFLRSLDLDERLYDAIILAQKIKHHSGKKRQLQLIGKLMRNTDIEPIKAALDRIHLAKASDRDKQHKAERTRDALVNEPLPNNQYLLESFDSDTRSELERLAREAHAYQPASPAHKKVSRTIFRLVFASL